MLLTVLLIVVPGFWAYWILRPSGLGWRVRCVLAISLGPPTSAALGWLVKGVGGDLAIAGWTSIIVGIPGVVMMVRELDRDRWLRWPSLGGVWALALPVAWVVAAWLIHPLYRLFNWHALLQSDVCYVLSRPGLMPQEPEMAGLPCVYSWWTNLFWSVVGTTASMPPTALVVAHGLVALFVLYVAAAEAGRIGGRNPEAAWLTAGLVFFGTNLGGIVAARLFHAELGMIKYTPLLGKHTTLDPMTLGMSYLAGLVLVAMHSLRGRRGQLGGTVLVLLVALGMCYPFLLPAGALVVACWLAAALVPVGKPLEAWNLRHALGIFVPAGAGLVIGASFVTMVSSGRSEAGVFLGSDIAGHLVLALKAVGLFFVPVLVVVRRNRLAWFAILTGVGLAVAYVVFSIQRLEYKFLLAATIALAPACAEGMLVLVRNHRRLRTAVVYGLPAALAAGTFWMDHVRGYMVPANLRDAPHVVEDGYQLRLAADEPDAAWTQAIREHTAIATIVISRRDSVHIATFTNRTLYAPSDYYDLAGYSLSPWNNLVQLRGHAESEYNHRIEVVQAIYDGTDAARARALDEIAALGQPIALHVRTGDRELRAWIERTGRAKQLHRDANHAVFVFEVPRSHPA